MQKSLLAGPENSASSRGKVQVVQKNPTQLLLTPLLCNLVKRWAFVGSF